MPSKTVIENYSVCLKGEWYIDVLGPDAATALDKALTVIKYAPGHFKVRDQVVTKYGTESETAC